MARPCLDGVLFSSVENMMIDSYQKKYMGIIIPAIYFLVLVVIGGLDSLLPSFIMSCTLFVTMNYVYDYSQSIFTMSNIICVVGFYIGYFARFFVSICNPSRLTAFAPYPLIGDMVGHLKSSSCFFVFIVVYALIYRSAKQKITNRYDIREGYLDDVINNFGAMLTYICVLVICVVYNIINSRISTQVDYGVYDQFFRIFGLIEKLFAYAHLYLYIKKKMKKNLFCYLIYVLPSFYMAFVSAWKGTFIIEILVLCVIFHTGIKHVKKIYVLLVVLVFLIVFPVVGMMRDSYRWGGEVNYNIKSIIEYNVNNKVFDYILDRMAYYDGTYYAVNVSPSIAADYKLAAGSIVGRFLSGMIPRMIWQDKPIVNVGSHVTYVLLRYPVHTYTNLTIGLLADAYLDANVVGIVGIALMFGWLVGKNETRNSSNDILTQSYYIVMGRTLYGFLEGDIAAKSLGVLFLVVTYFIWTLLCNKKNYAR